MSADSRRRVTAPTELLASRILIIDDEPSNVGLIERFLAHAEFKNFVSTTDPREAASLFVQFQPDLVLTDWAMPHMGGWGVIEQIRTVLTPGEYLPIVVLTGDMTRDTRQLALRAGATDFLTKPLDQAEVILRITNLLYARVAHLALQREKETLEDHVRERTLALEGALAELHRSQQQVIQHERLAALGTMAGGIAHDFNNALSIITGFGEMLLRDAEHGLTREKAIRPIETILTAAEDAAKVVHRLREFYRPDESGEQHAPLDLNQLMEQAVALTRPRWETQAASLGSRITVTTQPGAIPNIRGAAAELREALTNLIFNAVDALPEGGQITLRTELSGGLVALSICDTGNGMSEEVRRRCLEPFFTTKGARGTGLGLAMVFGIIQRHGGTMDLQSAPGEGTTFTFRFPVALSDPHRSSECGEQRSLDRLLQILVVDDQPILCELLAECLSSDGHRVTTAINPHQALERFRAGAFDLVITDHAMEGITGTELATRMKELSPRIPIVLLTGYRDLGSEGEIERGGADIVLGKPISHIELRRAIASLLAAA